VRTNSDLILATWQD
jgi:hypothetical protein